MRCVKRERMGASVHDEGSLLRQASDQSDSDLFPFDLSTVSTDIKCGARESDTEAHCLRT